jgi:dTDP-glucose 4,6-dehydratase
LNIVITGGLGFLGQNLAARLLAEGHHVLVIDPAAHGRQAGDPMLSMCGLSVTELKALDVTFQLFEQLGQFDRVYHLASFASPPDYKARPLDTLRAGTTGTDIMLQIMAMHGAPGCRFLLASTSEIYGQPQAHPQPETYWGNVNPIGPRACYDESKRAAEAFTMAWHTAMGADTRIARIFNTYGPMMRLNDGRMIPEFCRAALACEPIPVHGDGNQTRTLCYVDDTIDGLIRLMEYSGDDAHEPVNIGGSEELSVREIALRVHAVLGGPGINMVPQPCPDDPVKRKPDISRARDRLGWTPKTPFHVGLGPTIDWFRSIPLAAVRLPA